MMSAALNRQAGFQGDIAFVQLRFNPLKRLMGALAFQLAWRRRGEFARTVIHPQQGIDVGAANFGQGGSEKIDAHEWLFSFGRQNSRPQAA